jgi:hypothetical protein
MDYSLGPPVPHRRGDLRQEDNRHPMHRLKDSTLRLPRNKAARSVDDISGSRRSPTRSGASKLSIREPCSQPLARSRVGGGRILTVQFGYSSGVSQENRQLQLIITAQKGVSLDFDAAGRDAKTQSKELYLWGQKHDDGVKGELTS